MFAVKYLSEVSKLECRSGIPPGPVGTADADGRAVLGVPPSLLAKDPASGLARICNTYLYNLYRRFTSFMKVESKVDIHLVCRFTFIYLRFSIHIHTYPSIIGNPCKDSNGLLHIGSAFGTFVVDTAQSLSIAATGTKDGMAARYQNSRHGALQTNATHLCSGFDDLRLGHLLFHFLPFCVAFDDLRGRLGIAG